MFFSVDLLALKSSPYNRIWLLANENEKIKPGDMNLKTIKLAESLLEWLKRKTQERTSLPLSVEMAIGLSRTIHEQSKRLQQDCLKLRNVLKTRSSLEEKIPDAPEVNEFEVNTAPPVLDFSNIALVTNEEITLREDHLLPSQNMLDMEDDFFGEGQVGASTGFTMDIFDDGGPTVEEPVIPEEDPGRMVEDQPVGVQNDVDMEDINQPTNVEEPFIPEEDLSRMVEDQPVGVQKDVYMEGINLSTIVVEEPVIPEEDPGRMVEDQPEGVQNDVPLVDEPPAPQLDLDVSDVSIGPPRPKKARKGKKSKRLAIDVNLQLDQDEMRRLRQEKGQVDEMKQIPHPKALTSDQLLRFPKHRKNCSKEIQKSLKRAYDEGQCDFGIQDGHQEVPEEVVPEVPELPEEERRGTDFLQLPNQSHAETTLSTIREDATPNMGHTMNRASTFLNSFSSDDRDSGTGTKVPGAVSEVGFPLGIEQPNFDDDSQVRLEPIIENPELDQSEEVNPVEIPEPVQVPIEEQDDTASSVLSSEPASNIMPTPTFGRFEFIQKIPRNDTQDFLMVCDDMNLRSRREIAVAFGFLLEGLTDAPPKVSAEQDEFMSPIDVRRK